MTEVYCKKCGEVYDLGDIELVARYADATSFKTPCCKKIVTKGLLRDNPYIPLDELNQRQEYNPWIGTIMRRQ